MTGKEMVAYIKTQISSIYVTVAIVGNLECESALKSKNLQNSCERRLGYNNETYTAAVDNGSYSRARFIRDSAGYGLAQWTYWTRKQALYDYLKSRNLSIGDEKGQLDFMLIEMQGNSRLWKILNTSTDLKECSDAVMTLYERPANQSEAAKTYRYNRAVKILSEVNERKEYYEKSDYSGGSIIDALKSINVDSSISNRRKIAATNGIEGYTGKADQNKKLLALFKEGKLKR